MKKRVKENYAECRVFTSALQVDFTHNGDYDTEAIKYALYDALEACGLDHEDYVDFGWFDKGTYKSGASSYAGIDFHWNEADGYDEVELNKALERAFAPLEAEGVFYEGMGTDDVSEYYNNGVYESKQAKKGKKLRESYEDNLTPCQEQFTKEIFFAMDDFIDEHPEVDDVYQYSRDFQQAVCEAIADCFASGWYDVKCLHR